jgi:hypothetical protein
MTYTQYLCSNVPFFEYLYLSINIEYNDQNSEYLNMSINYNAQNIATMYPILIMIIYFLK